jgi:perosamine synthetase
MEIRDINIPLSRPDITDREIEQVTAVLQTPHLSLGPKLPEFERIIADYVGVKHAVAVNSGTSALHLIIRALGIGEGDEVITTPFSFIASANCLLFEKARPVFVDIDPLTLNLNWELIEGKINDRTRAILAVDAFGLPADYSKLEKLAARHDLKLIEDSCEAMGAEYRGRKAGSFGAAGAFGFYPNKQITTGEGGAVVTDNKRLADLCRSMRNQGRDDKGEWLEHRRLGYNFRLSEINCALGIAQMQRIEEILQKRELVAGLYNKKLAGWTEASIPCTQPLVKRSWFVYVIVLRDGYGAEQRDSIIRDMLKRGINCGRYFTPIHLQPFYVKMFGHRKGDFPVTESVASRTIALPFYNNLSQREVALVVDNLKETVAAL